MLTLRHIVLVLAFFSAFVDDSAAKSRHIPRYAQSAQQPAAQGQRGTEEVPLVVKVLPAEPTDAERDNIRKPRENEASLTDAAWYLARFTLALVGVAFIQASLFVWQLLLIKDAAHTSSQAAAAARDNAEAVMNAEGAHLYPVLKKQNLKEVFQGPLLHPKWPEEDSLPEPQVTYCFKNYGKTPAVIESMMHGIAYYPKPSKNRVMYAETRPLEIVVGGDESREISCDFFDTLTFGKAKEILEYRGELLFFGEVYFRDFFNRRFQCIWEFEGRPAGFHLREIDQRPKPDANV
jgi:hypothetical protein